jgi:adenylosuccinate synthase
MTVRIVAGGFWGDEGKGKVVAYLALADRPDVVARGGVGPNAGHTIFVAGTRYVMRQVPTAFVHREARLLIGAGVLVDVHVTLAEIERLAIGEGRLGIDRMCALIEADDRSLDQSDAHLRDRVGTTGTGTGPANEARAGRRARLARDEPLLARFLADVPAEVNAAVVGGRNVLVEGTQGFGLSLYYGDYPFVTSKDTTAGTFCADVGIGPTAVDHVLVVFKAYASRVGEGPMPTEMSEADVAARSWEEFGAVTGRRRRIGEFDFALARRAVMINGATEIAITNLDRRFPETAGVRRWDDLSTESRQFVERVETELDRPAALVSTGADVHDMVDRRTA